MKYDAHFVNPKKTPKINSFHFDGGDRIWLFIR